MKISLFFSFLFFLSLPSRSFAQQQIDGPATQLLQGTWRGECYPYMGGFYSDVLNVGADGKIQKTRESYGRDGCITHDSYWDIHGEFSISPFWVDATHIAFIEQAGCGTQEVACWENILITFNGEDEFKWESPSESFINVGSDTTIHTLKGGRSETRIYTRIKP